MRSAARTVVAAALLVFVGMASPDGRADTATKAERGSPRAIVAVVPKFWPPQYLTDEKGHPAGFAIDVMDAVAKRAGMTVTYKVVADFPSAVNALIRGEADVLPNCGIVPERQKFFDFTGPVETFAVSRFVRRDSGLDEVSSQRDARSGRIGVIERNIGLYLYKDRTDVDLEILPNVRAGLFELVAGHIDALIYPKPVLLKLARDIGVEAAIRVDGPPLVEVKRGIAIHKGKPELRTALNAAVGKYIGSADYQKIYAKWYGKEKPYWTVARVAWSMGAVLVLALVGMALWRYRTVVELNRRLAQSEQNLRAFVDNAPALVSLKDVDGNYLMLNARYADQLGFDPVKDRGRTNAGKFSEDVSVGIKQHESEVIDAREPVVYEHVIPHMDGDHIHLCTKFPVTDSQGNVTSVGTISTDITDRKLAEKAAQEAREQSELANRAKSEFLANMSHELRTPLNSIIGFSEMLTTELFGKLGDRRYKDYATAINMSGTYLLQVINDILDISKIEAGEAVVEPAAVDLAKVVKGCVVMVADRAKEAGLNLVVDIPPAMPELCADERQVKQILLNLLSNSLKFTEKGGTVTVGAACGASGGIDLVVADTGVGIAAEDIPKVLQPFGQVADSQHRHHPGTGLGLSICRSLMELHGGSLDIDSQLGEGTTVRLHFPSERTLAAGQVACVG